MLPSGLWNTSSICFIFLYIDRKFFYSFQKGGGVVKKILIAVLWTAGLCCAQLMPADTLVKNMTVEDSLKAIKINAPVDYDAAVSTEDSPKGTRSHAMSPEAMGPNKRDLFSVKNSLIATGTVLGMVALSAMMGTTYIPPLNLGLTVLSDDESQVQENVQKDFLSPKEQRLLEMQRTEMGTNEP